MPWLGRGQWFGPAPSQDWEGLCGRTLASETGSSRCHPSAPCSRGHWWGEGHGQRRGVPGSGLGQPWAPTPVPPADAPSTHWAPRTPTRKTNWETKAGTGTNAHGHCQRGAAAAGRPTKGRGAGKGPGLHMPPLLGRRPSPGEVRRPLSGGTGRASPPDGCVLCESVIGGRVKECSHTAGWGAHLLLRLWALAGTECRPAGPASSSLLIS